MNNGPKSVDLIPLPELIQVLKKKVDEEKATVMDLYFLAVCYENANYLPNYKTEHFNYLLKAQIIEPENPLILEALGKSYFIGYGCEQDEVQGIKYLEKAAAKSNKYDINKLLSLCIRYYPENNVKLIECLYKVVSISPTNLYAWKTLKRITDYNPSLIKPEYAAVKKADKYIQYIVNNSKHSNNLENFQDENCIFDLYFKASIQAESRQFSAAVITWRKGYELDPSNLLFAAQLGDILIKNQNADIINQGLDALNQAIHPDIANPCDLVLAHYYWNTQCYEQAFEHYKKFVTDFPTDNVVSWERMSNVYEKGLGKSLNLEKAHNYSIYAQCCALHKLALAKHDKGRDRSNSSNPILQNNQIPYSPILPQSIFSTPPHTLTTQYKNLIPSRNSAFVTIASNNNNINNSIASINSTLKSKQDDNLQNKMDAIEKKIKAQEEQILALDNSQKVALTFLQSSVHLLQQFELVNPMDQAIKASINLQKTSIQILSNNHENKITESYQNNKRKFS